MNGIKQKIALISAVVLLQFGVLFSSRLAFARGAIEMNPLVHAMGLWPAKLLAIVVAAIQVYRSTRLRRLWIVVALYACIVGWNLLLVAKAR